MNACESATASKGMDANMGRFFAQEKMITTLAMSYKFSSSAAPIFLTRFYTSLLIERLPFSEAAGMARDALRMQRRRQSRCSKQYDIQDWFVPVVYMSNGDPQIVPRPTQLPRSTVHQNHYRKRPHYWNSFINGIHQWLSMVLLLIFRLLRTSSLAAFASRPSSRLPSETSPLMTCLTVETLDDRQRQPNPLRLNNFILSFEHSTFSEEMTFLHGPPIAGKSLFLDQLSRFWLSTKSVDRVYVIQARIFLEGQSLPHLIQGYSKFLYATAGGLLRTQNEELKPCQRVEIIIDHVDELFSNDLTSQQRARAKAHLDTFILNVVGKESDTFRPSLIVVGRQGSDWLHKHFNNFDFDPMHFHFDSRPALHHPR